MNTCNAISSKTLQKKFVPLTIDCLATIESPSFKNVSRRGNNTDERSIVFNPISSTTLPVRKDKESNQNRLNLIYKTNTSAANTATQTKTQMPCEYLIRQLKHNSHLAIALGQIFFFFLGKQL